MKLSKAIQHYGAMKRMLGMSFEQGIKVLEAFRSQTGELSMRKIATRHVLSFLDRSILSDVTWLLRYRLSGYVGVSIWNRFSHQRDACLKG